MDTNPTNLLLLLSPVSYGRLLKQSAGVSADIRAEHLREICLTLASISESDFSHRFIVGEKTTVWIGCWNEKENTFLLNDCETSYTCRQPEERRRYSFTSGQLKHMYLRTKPKITEHTLVLSDIDLDSAQDFDCSRFCSFCYSYKMKTNNSYEVLDFKPLLDTYTEYLANKNK